MQTLILPAKNLENLFHELQKLDYEIIGPRLAEGAIIYDSLKTPKDLPRGWGDRQSPGRYEVYERKDQSYFAYVVGPHSWKKYLHPSPSKLWSAKKTDKGFEIEASSLENSEYKTKKAFLGVRACERKAIEIFNKTFAKSIEDHSFIIAINCTQSASTCFCHSMKSGPRVDSGYDLLLTEIVAEDLGDGSASYEHYFVMEIGSDKGEALVTSMSANCPLQPATGNHKILVKTEVEKAISAQKQESLNAFSSEEARDLLARNLENKYWDEVATHCLSCANCTMSCPTCFCSNVEDVTDLSGNHTERWLRSDSCFSGDFSYIHGGKVRNSTRARYRQWMTHKLSTWFDQFGTSGCVGCGRCITWCPVGIDIRKGLREIKSSEL